jgi:hypothetical protein
MSTDAIKPLHYFHEELAEGAWQGGGRTAADGAQ